MTRNPLLLIGIIGTLVATAATVMYSRAPQSDSNTKPPALQVVAARDLQKDARLESADLAGAGAGGRLTPEEQKLTAELLGKALKRDVFKGGAITPADLYAIDTSAVQERIPPGLRGLPIRLKDDPSADHALVRSGDYVDVLRLG